MLLNLLALESTYRRYVYRAKDSFVVEKCDHHSGGSEWVSEGVERSLLRGAYLKNVEANSIILYFEQARYLCSTTPSLFDVQRAV